MASNGVQARAANVPLPDCARRCVGFAALQLVYFVGVAQVILASLLQLVGLAITLVSPRFC